MRTVVVVMGVSGAGKTAVGALLARRLDVPFQEGDALHPAANIARMQAGIPLDDRDRAPWLDRVAAWIAAHREGGVVSCSALRRRYRDRLREADAGLRFVLLAVGEETLRARLVHRPGHYMPATLLRSQLDTLELPASEETDVVAVDGEADIARVVEQVMRWLDATAQ